MGFDGVGQQRDVAVGEDEVVAVRGADREVACRRQAVPVLFLPHHGAGNRRRRGEGAHRLGFRGVGPVVGHDHLVRRPRLPRQRRQHQAEMLGPVVDGGDDADLHAARTSFGGHAQARARAGRANWASRMRLSG